MTPAGPTVARQVCERLAVMFGPPPGRTAAHWSAVADAYLEALEEFPVEALLGAQIDYSHDPDSKFFPMPGQIRGLAQKRTDKMRAAVYRAKKIAEGEHKAKSAPDDAATKAKVATEMRDLAAKLGASARSDIARPAGRPLDMNAPQSDLVRQMVADGLNRSAPPKTAPTPPDAASETFE